MLTLTWLLAGIAAALVVVMVVLTLRARTRFERERHGQAVVWQRGHFLGAELAFGRAPERNGPRLTELIDSTRHPMVVASALAVVIRQQADPVDPALFDAIRTSRMAAQLRRALDSRDANTMIEALEVVEALQVDTLLADAASLTRHTDPTVVRAATEAVASIDATIGIGILVGLVDRHDSWVLDSLGRAAHRLDVDAGEVVPLSHARWRSAPMLAQRALTESATFDPATVTDAIAALIGSLDDASPAKRLAAVTALAASVEHPAAQLGLAGALGASDRTVRYATAANLSTTVAGRRILERVAARTDGPDAAEMAAEILWSTEPVAHGLTAVAS